MQLAAKRFRVAGVGSCSQLMRCVCVFFGREGALALALARLYARAGRAGALGRGSASLAIQNAHRNAALEDTLGRV